MRSPSSDNNRGGVAAHGDAGVSQQLPEDGCPDLDVPEHLDLDLASGACTWAGAAAGRGRTVGGGAWGGAGAIRISVLRHCARVVVAADADGGLGACQA